MYTQFSLCTLLRHEGFLATKHENQTLSLSWLLKEHSATCNMPIVTKRRVTYSVCNADFGKSSANCGRFLSGR